MLLTPNCTQNHALTYTNHMYQLTSTLTVQFVIHQLPWMLHKEASHDFFKISTIIFTSSMHKLKFKNMIVSRCEININISACSFYAISLVDMDFNGCMFIKLGMNQRWSCFLHRLYGYTAYLFSSSCIHSMEDAVIRCMHKWCHHALFVQLNGNVLTHPSCCSSNTTASVVCGCECRRHSHNTFSI